MEDLFQEEMTDQEFQFCKELLKTNVKNYLEMDDQIKALNKAIVERRKKKNELSEEILGTMKKFEIDNMNTKNGKLIYSSSKSTKPLNKSNLISGLNLYFKDEDKAKNVSKLVLDSREKVDKVKLRRTINKKAVNNLSL
tara:strand:- start:73 stop:489 length:417 start_codon:yes stop_codon:yes gene_type:complete